VNKIAIITPLSLFRPSSGSA